MLDFCKRHFPDRHEAMRSVEFKVTLRKKVTAKCGGLFWQKEKQHEN
jgi:hypothetical protein